VEQGNFLNFPKSERNQEGVRIAQGAKEMSLLGQNQEKGSSSGEVPITGGQKRKEWGTWMVGAGLLRENSMRRKATASWRGKKGEKKSTVAEGDRGEGSLRSDGRAKIPKKEGPAQGGSSIRDHHLNCTRRE